MSGLDDIAERVEEVLERARELVDVNASFGEARSFRGVEYVPVAVVARLGGIAGGNAPPQEGDGDEEPAGGGAGGGFAVSVPVGFLTEEDHRVVFNPILAPPWAFGTRAVDLLARFRRGVARDADEAPHHPTSSPGAGDDLGDAEAAG